MNLTERLDDLTARWSALDGHPQRHERSVRIAGADLHVVVVGDELAGILLPPFAAHPPAVGPPRATVGAWDAAATGVELPPVVDPIATRWTATRDGHPVVEIAVVEGGALRWADRDASRFVLALPSAAAVTPWERGAPLRRQLLWALWPDAQLVHAAGVATEVGAALLVGPSGAGKSSTAMACGRAGLGVLGDDHCAARAGAPTTVHLLHPSARLLPEELVHVEDVPDGTLVDQDKALVRLAADRLCFEAPLRAILLLDRGGNAPGLHPLTAGQALRQVAPQMLWQQKVDAAAELRGLRDLLQSVPVHRLVLDADRTANPHHIAAAIATA